MKRLKLSILIFLHFDFLCFLITTHKRETTNKIKKPKNNKLQVRFNFIGFFFLVAATCVALKVPEN